MESVIHPTQFKTMVRMHLHDSETLSLFGLNPLKYDALRSDITDIKQFSSTGLNDAPEDALPTHLDGDPTG
jgi:hypothetical protein